MEFCLTAEEVLYLAAVAGADTFYGVPDILSGLSDQELGLKIVEIEQNLGTKGYLEEDFDANRSIMPALMEAIALCGNCDRFLHFEKEQMGEAQYACMYFIQGSSAYKMMCDKDAYIFRAMRPGDIREEVEQGLSVKTVEKKGEESFSLSYEELDKAGTLTRRGSAQKGIEILRRAGASDFMAQEIINGILNKADFYALLFMDFRNEGEPGYSVQYLEGTGLTMMQYEIKEDQDYVRFLTVDKAALYDSLRMGFEKIGCQGEREEFL